MGSPATLRGRRPGSVNILGIAVIAGVLVAWQLAVMVGWMRVEYLPAPSQIITALAELLTSGEIVVNIVHTLLVVLQAWVIAVVIGTVAGFALGRSVYVRWFFGSTVDVLRSLPIVALVPVVLLLLGPTRDAEVLVAAYGAVWPMLVNVAGSVQHISPRLRDVAVTFGMSRFTYARKIMLPATFPGVLVGARLALGLALVLVIVAEMIGNPTGLGYALVRWQFALRPDAMWACLAVICALGLLLNWVLIRVGSRWSGESGGRS